MYFVMHMQKMILYWYQRAVIREQLPFSQESGGESFSMSVSLFAVK